MAYRSWYGSTVAAGSSGIMSYANTTNFGAVMSTPEFGSLWLANAERMSRNGTGTTVSSSTP
jgi:hypothetical protein